MIRRGPPPREHEDAGLRFLPAIMTYGTQGVLWSAAPPRRFTYGAGNCAIMGISPPWPGIAVKAWSGLSIN